MARRSALFWAVTVVALLGAAIYLPAWIAQSATAPDGPVNFLTSPEQGWRFVWDAVREVPDAHAGSPQAAGRAAVRPFADEAMLRTRYRLLRRVVAAVVGFLGVMAVLLSVDATRSWAQAVLASSTVLGLVVGFAARSTLANFVAGVMIAVNQPVRLGDRISVGDAEGTVEDIGLAYTRLRTADNRRVLIPNEELANSPATNMTIVDPISP